MPPLAGILAGLVVLVVSLAYLTGSPDPYHDPPLAEVDCRPGGTKITVASSPEKFEELGAVARQFNAFHCGGTAAVNVSKVSSGEALRQLRDNKWTDGAYPQVWSPAATSWVRRLQHSDPGAVVAGDLPSVTRTPLVLAMPQPIADRVGEVSWARVISWAGDPALWNKDTGGQWGAFKLGKTDPHYSTSGLHSLLATFTAAAGHAPQPADFGDTPSARQAKNVEQAALHYGDTTLYYLCALAQADQSAEDALGKVTDYVTAVPVEEKSVREYNAGKLKDCPNAAGRRPTIPLTAVHPTDGTIWSDSPYAVLSKASPAERDLAGNFLRYLHDKDAPDADGYRAPQKLFQSAGFRPVLDTAEPADANPQQIVEPDPAVLDALLAWWTKNRKQADVIFLVDVSGSMRWAPDSTEPAKAPNRRIDQVVRALKPAIADLDPTIRAGLWTFSGSTGDPRVRRVDKVANVGAGRPELQSAIGALDPKPSGDTALYDAIVQARDTLGPVSEQRIAAVVVLTDGENDICPDGDAACLATQEKQRELLTSGPKDRVRVFTIGYGPQAPRKVLAEIAASNDTRPANTNPGSADLSNILTNVTRNF